MREKRYQDDLACFLCDYWYLILIVLGLLFWGIWLLNHISRPSVPISTPMPNSTATPTLQSVPLEATSTPTPRVLQQSPTTTPKTPDITPTIESTPATTPTKPVYIFGFVPVNWTGSKAEFNQISNEYMDYYVLQSGMDQFFDIQLHILSAPAGMNANNEDILNEITNYGMLEFPADRYIGITSQDIILDGDSSVVGFTQGDNAYAVISEAEGAEIVTHELGHTFGLCDEYDYEAWTYQNAEMPGGCPNPLASSCKATIDMCLGVETEDGKNSMMGAAGMPGGYGFNTDCYDYLQKRFRYLVKSENQ